MRSYGMVLLFGGLILAASPIQAEQVCDAQTPATTSGRFIDNGDGTISDIGTELIWMRCHLGLEWNDTSKSCTQSPVILPLLTWQTALQATQDLNTQSGTYASVPNYGYTDWRVPNIKELASLIELQCALPATDVTVFPDTGSAYWTSSPVAVTDAASAYNTDAWIINFNTGREMTQPKDLNGYARLVRDM